MPVVLPSGIEPLEVHEISAEYDRKRLRAFVEEAAASGGAELANAQSIFNSLCEAIHVPKPALKSPNGENAYVFEEDVKEEDAARRIDVYKRGGFVFEAKQGVSAGAARQSIGRKSAKEKVGHSRSVRGAGMRGTQEWADAMREARHQAGNYAVHVTKRGDPKPPFLIVADVGYCFWIWSSFTRDAQDDYGDFELAARFEWQVLERPEIVAFLRQIWLNPDALNEEVLGQKVTAEIAGRIGDLALHLERRFSPEQVGDFLMKCVFTMFAEDVDFLPVGLFARRLGAWMEEIRQGKTSGFVRGLRALWTRMRDGGDLDSGHTIRRFNGYLFRDPEPLDLNLDEMGLLALAANANWRRVSPAIFGTLLERAISPRERQRLGAYYTPEAYIRRVVTWTVIEPLRAAWQITRAQIEMTLRKGNGRPRATKAACALAHAFRRQLAKIRVLDPACGSGNFLYVALKEMKRLEGEVARTLVELGDKQQWLDIAGETVHPSQFVGIETKPWAAKIAELVLWIGYLQWEVGARRLDRMPEPILQDLHHIRTVDALITWQQTQPVLDEKGQPVLRAVGVTNKKGTRRMVPIERFVGVSRANWPDADFVVGNPPFVGNKRMKDVLGPGYVDAVRSAFPTVPGSADLVMYWWWRCAELLSKKKIRRFGLVTTNSITQTLNRPVVAEAIKQKGVRIVHAIPDHPWYDEGAQVRIAMTVADTVVDQCTIGTVADESATKAGELHRVLVTETPVPEIHADLGSGARVRSVAPLRANDGLASQGITPLGDGFRLSREDLGRLGVTLPCDVVKPYVIGDSIVDRLPEEWIIDFTGLSAPRAHVGYPVLFDHVARTVRPLRENQNDPGPKARWWLFGRGRSDLRSALAGLRRYIATSRTSRHRVFVFLPAGTLPDTKVVAIAVQDGAYLAVLSSRLHIAWANRAGGWLGVGNDSTYNHTEAFSPFPLPSWTPEQRGRLDELGERLDAHRKARQAEHPDLTLNDVYAVLAKVRVGGNLDGREEDIRSKAMLDALLVIHDEIDRATLDAYSWPLTLSAAEIVAHLVDLNAERAEEEARGLIRWLRPNLQRSSTAMQVPLLPAAEPLAAEAPTHPYGRSAKRAWPADLPGRIQSLTALLRTLAQPVGTRELAAAFRGVRLDDLELTLQCAAAADAVVKLGGNGSVQWAARE